MYDYRTLRKSRGTAARQLAEQPGVNKCVAASALTIAAFSMFGLRAQGAPLGSAAFAYDGAAPLGVKVLQQNRQGTLTIEDITFPSPQGGIIHAQLILPRNQKRLSAVLFVHWLGDAKTTNRSEFYRDAITLARRGSAALLIDAMWAKPNWFMKVRTTDTDYAASIGQVIELRRSLDVLLSQPGVEPSRVAYVGHDFGAMYGAVLSGVDQRVRWYVLMAGNNSFADWYLLYKQPADKEAFVESMAPLEPLQYLAKSKADEFLFQFAIKDRYITPAHALLFASAAPYPHGMFFYKSDHSLNVPEAFLDRVTWLDARLNPLR
ncbi:MAG: hypothetical protein DLM50_08410 [Candidatus Meridianibacter frigidus]|nr:MAG: hypothetical protein DLM50_08410 [Candidatus Eremiobacteraeota bacterium]